MMAAEPTAPEKGLVQLQDPHVSEATPAGILRPPTRAHEFHEHWLPVLDIERDFTWLSCGCHAESCRLWPIMVEKPEKSLWHWDNSYICSTQCQEDSF